MRARRLATGKQNTPRGCCTSATSRHLPGIIESHLSTINCIDSRYSGLVGKNIPLDITNSEVIDWQISTYAVPAAAAGFDAIAADMFGLGNAFGACGVWEAPGKWKTLYKSGAGDCKVVPPITPSGCACYWNMTDTTCACCSANKQEHCCQVGKRDKHACAKCKQQEHKQEQTQEQEHEHKQDRRSGKSTKSARNDETSYQQAQIGWLRDFRAALAKSKVVSKRGSLLALIPNFAVHGTGDMM